MNDAKYRKNRRLLAYVSPDVKKNVLAEARKAGRSMSQTVERALRCYYSRGGFVSPRND